MGKLGLVLAAGAMLGLTAGAASAARFMDQPGSPNSPTGTGIVTDAAGFQESGSPYTGGQGLETETAVPWSTPASKSVRSVTSPGVAPGAAPAASKP
jgi:hypothetical protein